jgi:energy-coupling factor transporter ATP-binding protein EcfA2
MRLVSIKYSEYPDTPSEWSISDFALSNINLLVGKNAAGKTRTLRVINGLASLISGKLQPSFESSNYHAMFKDETLNINMVYELSVNNRKVTKERLLVNGKAVIDITRGSTKNNSERMVFEKEKKEVDVQIPETTLAVAVRRDNIQHSYIEPLYKWALSMQHYTFAEYNGRQLSVGYDDTTSNLDPVLSSGDIVALVKYALKNIGLPFKKAVIDDMKEIGYELSEFGVTIIPASIQSNLVSPKLPEIIYIKEKGIAKPILHSDISHGMLCAFVIIVQFRVNLLMKKLACILVDDVGEGLDFERSTKLISILIQIAEEGKFQLVMTTNDRFVMNKVPLKYWCVIQRERGIISTFNYKNSPEAFEEFEEYGSSNFDFFSKQYFLRKPSKKPSKNKQ